MKTNNEVKVIDTINDFYARDTMPNLEGEIQHSKELEKKEQLKIKKYKQAFSVFDAVCKNKNSEEEKDEEKLFNEKLEKLKKGEITDSDTLFRLGTRLKNQYNALALVNNGFMFKNKINYALKKEIKEEELNQKKDKVKENISCFLEKIKNKKEKEDEDKKLNFLCAELENILTPKKTNKEIFSTDTSSSNTSAEQSSINHSQNSNNGDNEVKVNNGNQNSNNGDNEVKVNNGNQNSNNCDSEVKVNNGNNFDICSQQEMEQEENLASLQNLPYEAQKAETENENNNQNNSENNNETQKKPGRCIVM